MGAEMMKRLLCAAILLMPTTALAEEELSQGTATTCIEMLDFGIEGIDPESCEPIFDAMLADETTNPHFRELIEADRARKSQPMYGHVDVIAWPEKFYGVDGPDVHQTLEYISQITVPSRIHHYIGGVSDTVTIDYKLDRCKFYYEERYMCGDSVRELVQHGFDLSNVNLNATALHQGRVHLRSTNGDYYNKRSTIYGQCDRSKNMTAYSQPRVSDNHDLFFIFEHMIRDQRADYAMQMQKSLHQLARMCGSGQETLLFD